MPITPALPAQQHDAIARLKYGRATKTLLQFSSRFWRAPGRPRAFGSPLPFGAVWDGNEEQRGRAGILTLLAGGERERRDAGDRRARTAPPGWPTRSTGSGRREARSCSASRQIVWEHDPLARGGYAYFDPAFDPSLRALARASLRPALLRRRAHQPQVAGLHERRGRKRAPRRGRNRRRAPDGDCGRGETIHNSQLTIDKVGTRGRLSTSLPCNCKL